MGKTPWIGNLLNWQALPLIEQLELLRKHYCTGPCGQSSAVMATRSATDQALRAAIKKLQLLEIVKQHITVDDTWYTDATTKP